MKALLLLLTCTLAAQQLVVDRPPSTTPSGQKIEAADGGFLGDAFRIGASGEIWFIDAIRVWALPDQSPSCPKQPGDRFAGITLLGALDNPPIPGQPLCDCHALTGLAIAPLIRGASRFTNGDVKLTAAGGLWQIDFSNLKWSVPGATDVIFSVRVVGIPKAACGSADSWALSVSAAAPDYRLHTFNQGAVPTGLAADSGQPRWINVQVWGHRAP